MSYLNAVLRAVFDLLLAPFSALPPLVGLLVVSLVTAVIMLLVVKTTSNQAGIAAVKRRIHACLFEIRLFNDDFVAILRAQGEILRHNVTYLRLSLVPMVWIMVPLVLVVAQLQFHYGYSGLRPGARVLVELELKEEPATRPDVTLDVPAGLRVETPAVWIPELREVVWRLAVESAGAHELTFRLGDETLTKTLRVTDALVRLSPVRLEPGFVNQVLYPAEAPLPGASRVRSISLAYAEADVSLLGWETHWLIAYVILSIVFAFALRNRLGVEI